MTAPEHVELQAEGQRYEPCPECGGGWMHLETCPLTESGAALSEAGLSPADQGSTE